ncbi:MAG: SHOCT domain-containing protein [Hyphomonadaceae bacterium]
MARGFASSAGNTKQATFAGAPQDAFAQATRAIAATGGEIMWQQPPSGAKFLLAYKNIWTTGGFSLKYDGDLQVIPAGPGQTTARFGLKVQWGSVVPLLVTQVLCVIILAMFNYYFAAFALILIIASLVYSAWSAASGIPDKLLDTIIKNLQSGAGPAPAQAYTPAPQPAPAPQPTPAPQPAPANNSAAIMEQIKQLGGLRDAGVLTPEEFETKKAELLSRI